MIRQQCRGVRLIRTSSTSLIALAATVCPVWADGADTTPVPTVTVTDSKPATPTGKAEEGYRQGTADLGPLGERPLLDTPFSVLSAPADLIRNEGVQSLSELTKYIPSLQQQGHPALEFGPPVIRGMMADDSSANTRIDGMNVRGDTTLPIELYDRMEILTGPSGSFYGFSYPAGTVNGILKRPTDKPFEEFSTDYTSNGNYAVRADLSGHADDEHRFGYRINVLHGDGEPAVSRANFNREVEGIALDIKPFDGTLIQGAANHYYFEQTGYPAAFAYSGVTKLPGAPDPDRAGYGQTYAGVAAETDIYELKVKQDLAEHWKAEAGVLRQNATRFFNNRLTNTLSSANNGTYTTTYSASSNKNNVTSTIADVTGEVMTGGIKHNLVLGFNGYQLDSYSSWNSYSGTLGTASLSSPLVFADPGRKVRGPFYLSSMAAQQTLVQSDTVDITKQWSVLGSLSESWLRTESYDKTTGKVTASHSEDGALGYTGAVMYKPTETMSVYASYGSSVQPGDTVSATSTYKNAGQVLAPYRSEQYELGYKATVAKVDLTSAVFRLERPFAAPDTAANVYTEMGNQRNWGVELTAKGKVTDDLTLFGGVTWLDARMEDLKGTPYSGNEGNRVVGVPEWRANVMAEYRLPFVDGLTATANVHYTGRRPANAENTSWADGFATLDFGARYETEIKGHTVAFRAGVDNVFDEKYWLSINGNMNGTTGATNTAYLGSPRTFKLSASVKF